MILQSYGATFRKSRSRRKKMNYFLGSSEQNTYLKTSKAPQHRNLLLPSLPGRSQRATGKYAGEGRQRGNQHLDNDAPNVLSFGNNVLSLLSKQFHNFRF